ncbi:Alpha-aminoadipate reductase Lys1p [Mycena chlorophos]|uniref:Alpha-aminoadipate reductase Lys1p n=1 Tax=Mycena chlorophos TaxID=658473 RepID=A0A8H6W048_MYCCL|nr:Alpha-aminoadipate reductase Lys1p [Mycena chlorophos]
MSTSSPPAASLISSVLVESLLETGLYGVYAVLFVTVLYLFRSRDRRPSKFVLGGLTAQFAVTTAHWINMLYTVLHTLGSSLTREEAGEYLGDVATSSFRASAGLCQTAALIANLLVIHRLHVIFTREAIVVVPALVLLMAQTVSSGGFLYLVSTANRGEQLSHIFHISNPWVTSMLATSLLVSVYCTGSIAWRILYVRRGLKPGSRIESGNSLISVLSIIVESAALQMASTISLLITYQIRFVGLVVFNGSMPVLLAISTVLIYARIGLGWAHGESKAEYSLPIRFVAPRESEVGSTQK